MTGLLIKKYHIAILDNETDFVKKVIEVLKLWYSDRVVIRTYSDTYAMFEAVSINKARNKPFDMAVVSPEQVAERMVLQSANPTLKVVTCCDEKTLKTEASKVLL